jgi:hypothetical protein
VIWAGPIAYQAAGAATAGWVTAAASATTAQSLVTGATGASGAAGFAQAFLPQGFWQRPGQHVKIVASGIASWLATAGTTMTWSFGLTPAAQGAATTLTSPTALMTSQAYPGQSTAQAAVPWRFDIDLLCTKVGVGTTAVSTSVLATGFGGFMPAVVLPVASIAPMGPLPPLVTTTIDSSATGFIYGAVTFGTNASASNTCTMLSMYVYGMN